MNTALFECPDCGAQYKVAKQEAPRIQDDASNHKELACLTCGRPLDSRDGKFVLKYFRVKRSRPPPHSIDIARPQREAHQRG